MSFGPTRRDRPLAALVDVGERPALWALVGRGVDDDSARLELLARARRPSSSSPSAVKRCASSASSASWTAATPPPPPASSHSSLACAISPGAGTRSTRANRIHSTCPTTATRMHRVCRHPSTVSITHARGRAFHRMMDAVATIPPFERFYDEHAAEVLGLLRRRLGRERAEDAFQETFLRALRAYDRLAHGEHLRAWVLTIAARVAIDAHRRAGEPTDELPELPHVDGRPAYEELAT